MDETIKKALIGASIIIVIAVIVYPVLGIITYTNNTVVYDEFPDQFNFNPNSSQQSLGLRIGNNAPMTFPLINPFYILRCSVEAENDAYVSFIAIGNKQTNFTDKHIDVGRINAGDFDDITILLHPDEGNLTLKVDVYLKFWMEVRATSNVYEIEYLGDYNYNITKIK